MASVTGRRAYVVPGLAGALMLCLPGGGMASPSWQTAASAFCGGAQRTFGPLAPCARFNAHSGGAREALWHVVHDLCVPMRRALSLSFPCLDVDETRGFAVLRAPLDKTQILVTPTAKIEELESPTLTQAGAPNFWALAWEQRNRVIAAAERPLGWDDLGMAVNAKAARSQDQLHIHVDCLDPRLKRTLAAHALPAGWATLDLRPWAGRYRVKRLGPSGLDQNLFKMIAEEQPEAAKRPAGRSIAVAGVTDKNGAHGFVVLVGGAQRQAEELLDHACAR